MWLVGTSKVPGNLPFRLDSGEFVVGRSKRAQIVIADATVSRRHATIVSADDSLTVEDLGSANGTFVNDGRIERSALRVGDHVRFGAVICAVSASPFLFQRVSETESTYEIPLTAADTKQMEGLTAAQEEIVELILKGRSEPEIAKRLGKSRHTIHAHLKIIYRRFDVHSRAELIVEVLKRRRDGGLP